MDIGDVLPHLFSFFSSSSLLSSFLSSSPSDLKVEEDITYVHKHVSMLSFPYLIPCRTCDVVDVVEFAL